MATSVSLLGNIARVTTRLAVLGDERDVAVAKAIEAGCTWSEIGAALGVSPQAAHKRFRSLRRDPATGETWREPQLPL
jgi:hypothetical protein